MVTATVYTARQTARDVSKALGRDVDAKRVRQWVRDNVDAYDDDGYTAHQYSHALHARIVAGMVAKAKGARPTAASSGRKGASKAATTAKARASVKPASKVGPSMATPSVPTPSVTKTTI